MNEIALEPAAEMAAKNPIRRPNESAAYRSARQALLAEEIELRRHTERVAKMRRALPEGGEVPENYAFMGENGPTTLRDMFGSHDTLAVYSFMYGPDRKNPCPMCTSHMGSFSSKIADFQQRVGMAFVARSPIERLVDFKKARGWTDMPVFSDESGAYTRAYVHPEDADVPGYNVFTLKDGTIRHFWGAEMTESDPGQDPRGLEMDPLWTLLDTTPEGRGTDWYPKLNY